MVCGVGVGVWERERGSVYRGAASDRCCWWGPTVADVGADGGGWTYVAEPGRSTSDGTDVTVESRYGYHQWVFDLRGMSYDEAMFERITPLWCGSWGYGSANFINSCSMGVAFDQNHYHYFNGNVGHELRKQDFSLRAVGGSIRCSSCWVDSNGLLQASDAVAVAVKSDGSKIKWTSPSRKGNTYLEHMNFDAWVGYAGGCDLSGSVTTFQQRAWVRGPRSRVQEPASTCAEIKDRAPSSADGVYTLTAKDGTTRDVFCDMTTGEHSWRGVPRFRVLWRCCGGCAGRSQSRLLRARYVWQMAVGGRM